jgi:hypothetical protein
MPQVAPVIAAVSAVATVAGTVMSYNSQKKASAASAKQQQLSTDRSNRQAIREAQLQRAMAISAASSMGALGGSALSGGLGSLSSQLGSGLGFSSQMSSLSKDIEKYQQKAATWGAVASMGSTVFSAVGGFGAFGSTGDTSTKKPVAANSNLMQDPYPGKAGR